MFRLFGTELHAGDVVLRPSLAACTQKFRHNCLTMLLHDLGRHCSMCGEFGN
jgi:hypothetical protein